MASPTRAEILSSLCVTDDQFNEIQSAPQRSDAWFEARWGRITASQFGAAAGLSRYCSPEGVVRQKLWNTFTGNEATAYGTEHEDEARQFYMADLEHRHPSGGKRVVEEEGLTICRKFPWLAVSPDGIVTNPDGSEYAIEVKCPYRKRFYRTMPPYYYAQIQGIMGVMRSNGRMIDYCDFVVYTPESTQVSRYAFNEPYWKDFLFPRLHDFYMNYFLDRLVLFRAGLLNEGEVDYVES